MFKNNIVSAPDVLPVVPQKPYLIDVQVEFYGSLCLNPSKHPKVPTAHYALLNSLGTGCGAFGEETELIKQLTTEMKGSSSTTDIESVKEFLFKDNKADMGDRLQLPFLENTLVLG